MSEGNWPVRRRRSSKRERKGVQKSARHEIGGGCGKADQAAIIIE